MFEASAVSPLSGGAALASPSSGGAAFFASVVVIRASTVPTDTVDSTGMRIFATTPDAVADATVQAVGGTAPTIWVPGRLRLIFAVLRHLPRAIYRRLPL